MRGNQLLLLLGALWTAGCTGATSDTTDASDSTDDTDEPGEPTISIDGRWKVEEGRFPWQEGTWAEELTPDWGFGTFLTLDSRAADCWQPPIEQAEQALHYGPEYSKDHLHQWVGFVAGFPCGDDAEPTRIEGERDLGVPVFQRTQDGKDIYQLGEETWEFEQLEDDLLELRINSAVLRLRNVG